VILVGVFIGFFVTVWGGRGRGCWCGSWGLWMGFRWPKVKRSNGVVCVVF